MNCLSISASFPLVLVAQSIHAVYSSPSLWWCMWMRKTNKDRRRVSAYPDLGQHHHVKRKHKVFLFQISLFWWCLSMVRFTLTCHQNLI